MLTYPAIDPVAFHIFTWPVYWYGLSYLVAFASVWLLLSLRIRKSPRDFNQDQLSDIIFFGALGAIIGGRLGYMFFYNLHAWVHDPLLVFQTWNGGMSFHGGLLGVVFALLFCSFKMHKSLLKILDFVVPAIPLGLAAGRIGNFINGELWGRPTTVPWAMVFPHADNLPRHPSQLYQFSLEGMLLFIILWIYSAKPRPLGAVSGLFAIGYGVFRFMAECFREPDAPIGFIAFGWLTEGQLLSVPLILVGIILMANAYRSNNPQ